MFYRPEYDMQVVGKNLRRLRQKKHLTVDQVREYLCLGSVQAVYKYEKGLSYPQADTMFALMELYGANLYDITREHEEDERSSSFFAKNHKNHHKNLTLAIIYKKYFSYDKFCDV